MILHISLLQVSMGFLELFISTPSRYSLVSAMSSFESFTKKAHELKAKGLTDREIAEELNLQVDTITWLLLHEKERAKSPPPFDYSVNWSHAGSSTRRLSFIGWAMADLVKEAVVNGEFEEFDVVTGIEVAGGPLGMVIADKLEKPFAAFRAGRQANSNEKLPQQMSGVVSPNFSAVEGKRILLVTDVISTGLILRDVVKSLRSIKATTVGLVAFVDKRGGGDIEGVPVKALVNLTSLKK